MDDPGSTRYLLLLICLLGAGGFFTMSKAALISLNDAKLHKDADDGDKRAVTLCKMADEPGDFLSMIRAAVTLFGLLAAAFTADRLAGPAAEFFARFVPLTPEALRAIALVLLTLALAFLILTLGGSVPKRIGMHKPEKIAYGVSGLLYFCYLFFRPFVRLADLAAAGIMKLFGVDSVGEPEGATEENIRMMLDAGNENGTIEESERQMINNIFEFDDRTVGEVMTHRIDMTAVEQGDGIDEIVEIAIADGYSRIPVYEETIDNIRGVIYAKDLLSLIGDSDFQNRSVGDFIRPVNFVPESNSCREVFAEFQQKKIQLAIVVDEYGGTAGIISMEDLLESIVGNIQDEYDNEEEEISRIDEENFDFDGTVFLKEIDDLLGIEVPEDAEYDTLGGLLTDLLGRIPEEEEHPVVLYGGVEFTVLQTEEHHIAKVHAHILSEEEKEERKEE
ncbi:MAG TPA: hemolysin family protein [Oscillospiraceae bacterium]|nr:HlyC/CorC family transporter [Oscillospiraceae bacterium]HNW04508.1 hemolysin family protein [Oscillospiraceae bacterium]HPV99451.1 hemolysin family protein [Oscillospiraceae bacterium]